MLIVGRLRGICVHVRLLDLFMVLDAVTFGVVISWFCLLCGFDLLVLV